MFTTYATPCLQMNLDRLTVEGVGVCAGGI